MKTRDLNIILCLLAVGILIAGYYLLYRPEKDKEARLTTEINELQARYDELKAMEAHRDEYVAETEALKKQFDEEVAKYAPDLNQENTIIYLKGTEEYYETFKNITVGLPYPETFYTLGSSAPETGDIATEGSNNNAGSEPYVCEKCTYPITFSASYDEIKDYLDYVAEYKYRMNIESITMSYNPETELCAGTIALNSFAITGPDRKPDVPSVDQPLGVENIFVGEGAPTADSSKYAEDNGDSIIGEHNLVMLLNNAANDAASGVIVASNESDEKTYVTYEGNDVTDVKVSIYSDAGKNFVKYEIGGKSSETEILTDDFTIYVKSSERVDSDDKNGVKVLIDNTSTLSVFIKVVDDGTAGRFKLGSKTGTVKVY